MNIYLIIIYSIIGFVLLYLFIVILAIILFKVLELFEIGGVTRYVQERRVRKYLKKKYPGCRITRVTYDDYEQAFLTIIRYKDEVITKDYVLEKNSLFGRIIPKEE